MAYEAITTEYLCYLMNRVQIEAAGPSGYLELCKLLHATSFIPIIEMDENRSYECIELRADFIARNLDLYDSEGEGLDILDQNGTMLELLVVLSEKIQYELEGSEYDASTRKFFIEMLENAGLNMTNDIFDESTAVSRLELINTRLFNWDGEYSFFPLRNPHSDQRYQELIVQMNNYIEDNYDIC